jgi:hypothetical protein
MTTPQTVLWNIEYNTKRIVELLEGKSNDDEEVYEGDICDIIKLMRYELSNILASQQRQENLMHLIIKLLGKSDE